MNQIDGILSPEDVERISGIPAVDEKGSEHYTAQRNFFKRQGIKSILNAKKEVIVFWSWIRISAESKDSSPKITGIDEPDFGSLEERESA